MPRLFLMPVVALCAGLAVVGSNAQAQSPAGASRASEAAPGVRWRLRHGRQLQATVGLPHSVAPRALLKGRQVDLDKIAFDYPAGLAIDFEAYRKAANVDGFIVLQDGKVIFERYYDGFGSRDVHNWASMSKSIVGFVALRLAKQGLVDLDAPVSRYVPELAGAPFGSATLQQNLDMRTSVTYPKDLPPDRGLFAAAGLAPLPPSAPGTIHDFLRACLLGAQPHGQAFYYQNGSTEAVAWALEKATGKSLADLVETHVWAPMGAADDGYYLVDRSRAAFAAGGVFSTLGDLARFGEFVRQGDLSRRLTDWKAAPPSLSDRLRYRDFWWRGRGGAIALGRYGQRLAVIPGKRLVIAQFAAYDDERPRAGSTQEAAAKKAPDLRDGEAFEALTLAIAARL